MFTDVTAESGVTFVHVNAARGQYWIPEEMGPGGALLDADEDGDLDLYLLQGGPLTGDGAPERNRFYVNDGGGRFTDATDAWGAGITGHAMGAAAADVDNDGDTDVFVTRVGPDALLRNDGGSFRDVTAEAGLGDPGWGASAAFFDYDRDGWLDLFVSRYVGWSVARERPCHDESGARDYCNPKDYASPSASLLYRGAGGGRFEDVTEASGVGSARGNGLGVACADFDGDGWLDAYVANDQTPAHLWMNRRDGTFVEDAALRGCAYSDDGMAIAGMGVVADDLESDGDPDLLVTNIHGQTHVTFRNDGGRFTDTSHAWGVADWGVPLTGFGVVLFDQDSDGELDGFVANGAVNRLANPFQPGNLYGEPNQFVRRGADGRFRDATAEAGQAVGAVATSRGVLAGDLDGDGDVDLVVTNNGGAAQVLRNESDGAHAWTSLDVRGRSGARHALNARVAIEAAGRTWLREVRPHAGYLTSHDPRVHVGLGGAARIDRLTVTWADGHVETWTDLPVRTVLDVREGRAPAPRDAGP